MLIPWRIHSLLAPRLAFRALWTLALSTLAVLTGCGPATTSHLTSEQRLEGGAATIDARGATVDSEIYLHQRTLTEGKAGPGGSVRVSSIGGSVQVLSSSQTFTAGDLQTVLAGLSFAGNGLTVPSGEKVRISGGHVYAFLNVAQGGQLLLDDNTFIQTAGDVLIAGAVISVAEKGAIRRDGRDFTLLAGGRTVITGSIDSSGENAEPVPVANQPGTTDRSPPVDEITFGGNGGQVFIDSVGDVVVTGSIAAEGGGNDGFDSARGLSGAGGQIFIGSQASAPTLIPGGNLVFVFSGHLSVRAGNSYTNNATVGPAGGSIQVVTEGNILMQGVTAINASGGRNTGELGGDGGSIIIEAQVNDTTLNGPTLDVSGGRLTFQDAGSAGNGGTIALSGQGLTLADMLLAALGGDNEDEAEGKGGNAGTVTLSASDTISVDSAVSIVAMGGESTSLLDNGGDGGTFQMTAPSAGGVISFNGSANVRGGNSLGGTEGTVGTFCSTGSMSAISFANIVGINPYPLPGCTASDLGGFQSIVHDLDCDSASVIPGTFTTTLPAVLGRDYYRVFIPSPLGSSTMTISTSGASSGNIDLFVGSSGALGNSSAGAYAHSSTGSTSTESINGTVLTAGELSSLAGGSGFISVMVAENQAFVEQYTITITCQ